LVKNPDKISNWLQNHIIFCMIFSAIWSVFWLLFFKKVYCLNISQGEIIISTLILSSSVYFIILINQIYGKLNCGGKNVRIT